MASKKMYSRANSLSLSMDLDYSIIRSGNTKICYDLTRARALARWKRVQNQVGNATTAFSNNHMEKRRAFSNKKWYSINEMEYEAAAKRARSMDNSKSSEDSTELQELLPNKGCSSPLLLSKAGSSSTGEKSIRTVSFEDDKEDSVRMRRAKWGSAKR